MDDMFYSSALSALSSLLNKVLYVLTELSKHVLDLMILFIINEESFKMDFIKAGTVSG